MSLVFSSRPKVPVIVLFLAALSIAPPLMHAQASGRPATAAHRPAPQAAGPGKPLPSARLDMLVRLQAVALQAGDPARIASSTHELNAEILSLLASIASAEGRFPESEQLYGESIALQPDVEVSLRLANLLARSGQLPKAIDIATAQAAEQSTNVHALTVLGSLLRAANRNHEAATTLTRALELDPNPSVAFALGSALLGAHEDAKANDMFQRLLASSDGAAIWHVAIGDAYREAGYLEQAAAQFKRALAKDPKATHAEFFLGLVELQLHEWGPNSESFLHLRRSAQQNPHEYLSNFYLGALESTDASDLAASDRHLHAAADADGTQPEVWIYLGQNANREHRTDDAVADLRKAIQMTGHDEARNNYQVRRAYFTLGRLLIARGERAQGEVLLADYKRTGALASEAASANLAEKQQALQGDAGQPEATLRNLANDAATAPAVPDTQPETAPVSPQLRSAEEQLRALLSSSYNDLGTAEARQQLYPQAKHDFEQAQHFGGNSPALLRNLALVAFRLHDTAQVERSLTEYFGTLPAPVDERSRLMLAMAGFDLGHFAEAAKNFHAAGGTVSNDPRTVYTYAFSLARTGQAKEASALADTLVAANLPPANLALVCNVYFTAENYSSSASCYGKIAQQDPSFRTAHYFVAESLIHQDRPEDAIPELRQELALTPDEPNVQNALAFALSQTGHKDQSQAILTTTVAAHPEHADAQYQLGKLLAEQGNTAEAILHLEASVHDDGTKDYAHYQLATAYRKAGRPADAEREFAAYRRIKEGHHNDRAVPHPVSATP